MSISTLKKGMFYSVEEQMPNNDKLYYCYSDVYHHYYIARFTPYCGWLDQSNDRISVISHWLDWELPMPFEISDEVNEELFKKHRIYPNRGFN